MSNAQESKFSSNAPMEAEKALMVGPVITLGSHGGEVRILSGRVWLTSPGDLSDHVLEAGESVAVAGSGPTLVEAWDPRAPALIAWRGRTLAERAHDLIFGAWGRCWDLVNPVTRLGIGTAAAIAGLLAAGLLFGPLSQARVRQLSQPASAATVLHNADRALAGVPETQGSLADGSEPRDRASRAAQEARRSTPGAA